jgi:uncharacterized protein (TIGR02145 family)
MALVFTGLTFCVKEDPKLVELPTSISVVFPPVKNSPDSINLPTVTTAAVTLITLGTVRSGGEITDDGGGSITAEGVCWSISHNPTTEDNKDTSVEIFRAFIGYILELKISTTYYIRAFATNSAGTAYGNEVTYTTPASYPPINFNPKLTYGSVTDVDGNTYKTIQIGSQIWMAENLKTTKYNNGDQIFLDNAGGPAGYTKWFDLGDAYCWYDNDAIYKDAFGAIYSWHAVNKGNLCPTGWHVSTDEEWTILTDFLGGEVEALPKLMETGTTHSPWSSSNYGTNESGFTAFPVGNLSGWGFGIGSSWWSATSYLFRGNSYAILRSFERIGGIDKVFQGWEPQSYGYSVRCLKD